MSTAVDRRLHAFAAALLERRGALVEWPAPDREGTAVLSPQVAAALGTGEEIVSVSCAAAGRGLSVHLAGNFLEWSGRLLAAEPRIGTFRVRDLYLKRKEVDEALARKFTWTNAKVKLREVRTTTAEYHTWWFHAAMASEDRWETCFSFSLNAVSGVEVALPDPLGLWELEPGAASAAASVASCRRATIVARRQVLHRAAAFLERLDARLQRDRKRLRDYYQALLKEADKKKTRGHHPPDPEKTEAKKRAVQLELRRKLGELEERYAVQATVAPVVLIRTELPVLAVDLSVFRKKSHAQHVVYWNPLLKQFEPLPCGGCGEGAYVVAFTNEDVAPQCPKCSVRPELP